MKKLSIITICYNEPFLEKTCESIVKQTWQDFEWVVVDGGSNQETLDIFEKYKHRIDKFVSEHDNGVYNAMNKGIKLSSGVYLLFLNAGDFLYENTILEKIFVDREYSADILYGNLNLLLENNPTYIDCLPENINKEFLYISTVRHQASFIKKDLFEKCGLYDESYKIVADYEKWFVFLENNAKFEYVPYIISSQDMHGLSQSPKTRDIAFNERKDVINKKFTVIEIKKLENKYKSYNMNYSLSENLFSIKNNYNKTYKVFTFLGCHFYFEKNNNFWNIKTTETHKILTLFGIHIKLKLKKSPFPDKVKVYEPYSISETTIGDGTYIAQNSIISKTNIGKFCSIGPNFMCGWGIHPINGISTNPCFYSTAKQNGFTFSEKNKILERKQINIGNDVFIGMNVTILDGVTIGDGAVIGAGAVVVKDIEPYSVVGGVPAKHIKYRFSKETINELQKIEWWNFNNDKLKDVEQYFFDVDKFIEKYSLEVDKK